VRAIGKSPGVTLAVVLSISLGIAANTTVFSITNALLFGSLPVAEPNRLISIDQSTSKSWVEYNEFLEQNSVFEDISARVLATPASIGGGEPERVWGQLVTANYFDVLGLRPAHGRGFLPEEGVLGDPVPVAILSDALWRRRFGADPETLGREVLLNNHKVTVVGIMPPGFHGQDRVFLAEFWVPLPMAPALLTRYRGGDSRYERRGWRWLALTGRLKPGASIEEAEAEINLIRDRNDEDIKSGKRNRRAMKLVPAGGLPGGADSMIVGFTVVLTIVVGLVLLIACANVANILLARSAGRQKEIGIRLAMGASRGRLVRQLLTESILLSLLGASVGVLLSYFATGALSRLRLPVPMPISLDFAPDSRVLAFTAALAVLTGIIFGLAPSLRATNPDLVTVLKGQLTGFSRIRRFGLRNALVDVQVTLSLMLLVSAGLFLRSLQHASSIDIGMNPNNLLIMGFDPSLHGYDGDRTAQLTARLRDRVEALPGIQSMSFVDIVPLSLASSESQFSADAPTEDKSQRLQAEVFTVGTGYFATMGIPLQLGRDFKPGDATRQVAIINQAVAERLFPGENPVGRTLAGKDVLYEIVGVAANSKTKTLGEKQSSSVYRLLDSDPLAGGSLFGYSLVAKTAGDPHAVVQSVREQFRILDPTLAVFNLETMR
ncbi:MAG: ABC transporter permease, partial [bacterium]|nr:ABC transporter permease [bacterium]